MRPFSRKYILRLLAEAEPAVAATRTAAEYAAAEIARTKTEGTDDAPDNAA